MTLKIMANNSVFSPISKIQYIKYKVIQIIFVGNDEILCKFTLHKMRKEKLCGSYLVTSSESILFLKVVIEV
jgi:hypothetical protein